MATLVLLRHGQSVFNKHNEFCGWVDVPLSGEGVEEAKRAAERLRGMRFDVAFTSRLMRAQQTLSTVFEDREEVLLFEHEGKEKEWSHHTVHYTEVPVHTAVELNERYYGDLQGLNKEDTARKFGSDQVRLWRRSFDVRPPNGESLQDVTRRTVPYYEAQILPLLKQGKNVIVAAHGNSLRSIVMHIEHLLPEEIIKLELATGVPIVYDIDERGLIQRKQILE